MRSLFLLLIAISLSGCGALGFPGVYKIDVEQGNLVNQDMVDQLQPGMSRRQVRFILGTPLVEDPFNQSRWDYPYVLRNGNDIIRKAQMTVHFDGDSLVDVTGDYQPDWASGSTSDDSGDSAESDSDDSRA
ncbi:outer membrane protein assembly factor BamE [Parahaliea aestuarii]|uniref:Outer membrane protein assembly factor BamE n=1 Tax=Parahaliea aestuarii TaxID=1852021 RepID=A0A5C8ZR56_9GAMM|nr:outer membrane protein assembly factor BamE [Parahaliea aestuarii]TXS90140.1 outer membrane protein assembly factor BamE [Parahaliea aestuarii]